MRYEDDAVDIGARLLRDAYLADVRAALGGVPPAARDDLILELAAHCDDLARDATGRSAIERMRAALTRMGAPAVLAASLGTPGASSASVAIPAAGGAARVRPSTARTFPAHVASMLRAGARTAVVVVAAVLLLLALLKPFLPDNAGFFLYENGGFALGLTDHDGRRPWDPLGLWFVPLAATASFWALRRVRRTSADTARWLSATG